MTTALEHIRYSCGIAGEEVATYVDELEKRISEDTSLIEQLTARVRELEEENARLHEQVDLQIPAIAFKQLTEQLAVSQAYAEQLREAVRGLSFGEDWNNGTHAKIYRPKLLALLAQPRDTSALDAYVMEKHSELIESLLDVLDAKEKMIELGIKQDTFPSMFTMLIKQRDLAVEALERAVAVFEGVSLDRKPVYAALQTIKESEGK